MLNLNSYGAKTDILGVGEDYLHLKSIIEFKLLFVSVYFVLGIAAHLAKTPLNRFASGKWGCNANR